MYCIDVGFLLICVLLQKRTNQQKLQAKLNALNTEIQQAYDKRDVVSRGIDALFSIRSSDQGKITEAQNVVTQLKVKQKDIRSELTALQSGREVNKSAIDTLYKLKKKVRSEVGHTSTASIDEAIKKLEIQQNTTNLTIPEEKRLLKDISALREHRKTIQALSEHEAAMQGTIEQNNNARSLGDSKRAELQNLSDKISEQLGVVSSMKGSRDKSKEVQAKKNDRNEIHNFVVEKKEERNKLRAEFKAASDAYFMNVREHRRLKDIIRKLEAEAIRAEQKERRRAFEVEESKKIPYEEEMALCDHLVSYLETNFLSKTTKGVGRDSAASNDEAEKPTAQEDDEYEGKVLVIKKRDTEDFLPGRKGGKKNRGGKGKGGGDCCGGKKKAKGGDAIVHQLDTVDSFTMVSVAPPNNTDAVPTTIEALRAKKQWYSEQPRGSIAKEVVVVPASHKNDEQRKKMETVPVPDITEEEFPSLPGTKKDANITPVVEELVAATTSDAAAENRKVGAVCLPINTTDTAGTVQDKDGSGI